MADRSVLVAALAAMDGTAAHSVVDLVESELLTPLGLRSLARENHDYVPRYPRGPQERDGAYQQGGSGPA